jgi:hypothetical protein
VTSKNIHKHLIKADGSVIHGINIMTHGLLIMGREARE